MERAIISLIGTVLLLNTHMPSWDFICIQPRRSKYKQDQRTVKDFFDVIPRDWKRVNIVPVYLLHARIWASNILPILHPGFVDELEPETRHHD